MIELKNLTKQFKDIKAVDNINISIKKGEIFGILGENGAGKTTILRMIATMLKPSSGDVIVDGYSVISQGDEVRRRIGILFGGEMGLYDRLTVEENILYFADLNDVDRKFAKERISKLAKIFNMEDFVSRRAGKLSKGMKQKAAFARAIIHDPEVMLLDEPTSGLDVTAIRDVQDFILSQKEQNRTIIFSSHTMSEVEKLCDRIAIIHKGKLLGIDTVEGFVEKNNAKDLSEVFIQLVERK